MLLHLAEVHSFSLLHDCTTNFIYSAGHLDYCHFGILMKYAASEHSCTCQYDTPIVFKITLVDLSFLSV